MSDEEKAMIKEMIDEIVELRTKLIIKSVPDGHCPYAYYSGPRGSRKDGCDDCDDCHKEWEEALAEKTEKVVKAKYNFEQEAV